MAIFRAIDLSRGTTQALQQIVLSNTVRKLHVRLDYQEYSFTEPRALTDSGILPIDKVECVVSPELK
jgi:hypothetical protein